MAGLYYVLLDPHYFENNFFQNSIHLNVHEVLCSDFWHLCGMESFAGTKLRRSPSRAEWLLPSAHSSHSPPTWIFPPTGGEIFFYTP